MERPADAKIHAYEGMCLFRLGDFAGAEVCFGRATALDPRFVDAGVKRAQCFDRLHRYDEALARARRFLISTQCKDGSWPASETEGALSNTVHAMRALVAVGAQPSSPALRRTDTPSATQTYSTSLSRAAPCRSCRTTRGATCE